MKRFLIESLLFAILIFLAFIGFICYKHTRIIKTDDFCLAFNDKCALLDKSTQGKRVILVGGSNVAFGVDSKLLSDSTGQQTVNFGLHAGIGLDLPITIIDSRLKAEDIVVIMPEYDIFFGDGYRGTQLTSVILIDHPSSFLDIGIRQYCHFFKFLKEALNTVETTVNGYNDYKSKHMTEQKNDKIYSRYSFNEYGDNIAHLGKGGKKHDLFKFRMDFNKDNYKLFIGKIDNWKDRGIDVIVIPPCIQKEQYELNRTGIEFLRNQFVQDIPDYPNDIKNSIFEEDMMFDTYYHLNDSGRHLNTLRILHAIQNR